MNDDGTILESAEVAKLELLLEEATRSSAAGVRRFVEPANGTLTRATARTHHPDLRAQGVPASRACFARQRRISPSTGAQSRLSIWSPSKDTNTRMFF